MNTSFEDKNITVDNLIDPEKQYKTRNGKRVIINGIRLKNDIGEPVTYPVKGEMVLDEDTLDTEYMNWTLDGKADAVWPERLEHLDLILVES